MDKSECSALLESSAETERETFSSFEKVKRKKVQAQTYLTKHVRQRARPVRIVVSPKEEEILDYTLRGIRVQKCR